MLPDTEALYLKGSPLAYQQVPARKSSTIWYHLRTIHLFTKSDLKTTIFPQTIFAVAALYAPPPSKCVSSFDYGHAPDLSHMAKRLPLTVLWLFINCLIFDIANQSQADSVLEDSINKPWRPIPSGRITAAKARSWLLGTIFLSMALSYWLDALSPMTMLNVLFWMYNDLEGSSGDAFLRNILNAGGFMCFGWGALSVLAGGQGQLLPHGYFWLMVTGAIVLTSVHVQDLPDLEGDKARDRKTFPIKYGETIARWSNFVIVLFWSIVEPLFWTSSPNRHTSLLIWLAPVGLGVTLIVMAVMRLGQKWDALVFKLWCLWLMTIYLSPAMASLLTVHITTH